MTHKGKVPLSLHFHEESGMYCRGLYAYVLFPKRNAGPYMLLGSGTCMPRQSNSVQDCKVLAPVSLIGAIVQHQQ